MDLADRPFCPRGPDGSLLARRVGMTEATIERSALSGKVIGCAIEVHRELGPGLMEMPYRRCLARELRAAGLSFQGEVIVPLLYKGERVECGYRADFVVENELLIEIKSVDRLLPIHSAQVMTYLKLTRVRQALLFNFNVERLKDGMKSFLFRDPRAATLEAATLERVERVEGVEGDDLGGSEGRGGFCGRNRLSRDSV